ncbi:gamma-crystallin S-like [Perca fluviatilis]|uniref:gamma-crystallin S-like n=1 Tax=Perca fluviatilis TaxID=8168 RepID=UPI00196694CB|nr:gamma-crystallin S-like [Perca fluviatilis]
MGKIAFFEDKNFQGQSHECSTDCPDLRSCFGCCNSIRMESGCWVLYKHPNYTGNQYILSSGEYPDQQHHHLDSIKSCRSIKNVYGKSWKIPFYERPNFDGQSLELTEDMKSIQEKWLRREVQSCKVLEGSWIFFEHPNFCGRQYLLEKGEYRHHSEWGALKPTVGSIKIIIEL